MASGISQRNSFASYSGITQNICFKTDGKTIRAEVWDKNSGKLLATIDNLFIEALPSKIPQETLSWMLKNHYAFTWNHAQIAYHPTLRGGNNNELLDQLNDPNLITALFNDPERAQSYVKAIQEDPRLKSQLFDLVFASRTDPTQAVRAANSISLLNAARVPFSGMDLSGIRIPGAHLWGAILDGTRLDGADLTNVTLKNAFLSECSFKRAKMSGVQFGEAYLQATLNATCFAFSSNGKFLATAGENSTGNNLYDVCLWEVTKDPEMSEKTFQLLANICVNDKRISTIAVSPDGNIIAAEGDRNTVYLWEVITVSETGEKSLQSIVFPKKYIYSMVFSPDGKILATGNYSTVDLWKIPTSLGTEKRIFQHFATLEGHRDSIDSVAFSPDGKILATGSRDKTVRLWKKVIDSKTENETFHHFATLEAHTDSIRLIAFSPDGKILVTGSQDNTVCLWEEVIHPKTHEKTFQLLDTFRNSSSISALILSLAFSPNGEILAMGSFGNTILLWQRVTNLEGKKTFEFLTSFKGQTNPLLSQLFDTDISEFAEILTNVLAGLAFTPDGKFLVTSNADSMVRFWKIPTSLGTEKRIFQHFATLEGHRDSINSVVFSPDGKILATGSNDTTVHLWKKVSNPKTGEGIFQDCATLKGHRDSIDSLAFSPNGNYLATGSSDKTIRLWEKVGEKTFQCFTTLSEWCTNNILSLAFSSDGEFFIAGTNEGLICLWKRKIDPGTGKRKFQFIDSLSCSTDYGINSLAFSPIENIFAMGGYEETVSLWKKVIDPETGEETFRSFSELKGHRGSVNSVVFSPDGKILATGSSDSTVRLWREVINPKTGKKIFQHFSTFGEHEGKIDTLAFSPDGEYLAIGGSDKTICIWKKESNEKDKKMFQHITTLEGHTGFVRSVAFSPDGEYLVSSSNDTTVRSWKLFNDEGALDPRLIWVSNPNSLFTKGAQIEGVQGLSRENYALLMRHGALEPSTPLTLEDTTSQLTSSSSEKAFGKKSITRMSRETSPLEDAIQEIQKWINQHLPKQELNSKPLKEKLYIRKLLAYIEECKESPPKEKAELEAVIKYFQDQLRDFQAYYGNNSGGNKSSLTLLPLPNDNLISLAKFELESLSDDVQTTQELIELRSMVSNLEPDAEQASKTIVNSSELVAIKDRLTKIDNTCTEHKRELEKLAPNSEEHSKLKVKLKGLISQHSQLWDVYDAKMKIKQQQEALRRDQNLCEFYRTVQIKLEEVFVGYKAIASTLIDPALGKVSTSIHLLETMLSLVPVAGSAAASVIGTSHDTIDNERRSNVAKQISSLVNLREFQKQAETVARTLACQYEQDILNLKTLEEEVLAQRIAAKASLITKAKFTVKRLFRRGKKAVTKARILTPAERLGEFAVVCMVETLKNDELDYTMPLDQVLLSGISETFSELAEELKSNHPAVSVAASAMVAQTTHTLSGITSRTELLSVTLQKEIARRQELETKNEQLERELAEIKQREIERDQELERLKNLVEQIIKNQTSNE